eukprot:CAMPEP_0119005214 /NCGR_PEP_ID=MMETSP1176-20130426/1587_1 /TAXON_ID=265551 /ORGANISM="Synedropsis recta cf, Strain CCMP1620" /LENGTH=229 /DNA_ID=CAMNT_0006956991 /DNA_START=167 /DNA_END=856 /DNA_ORIENTATION=+
MTDTTEAAALCWYSRTEMVNIRKEVTRTSQGIRQRFQLDPQNIANYTNSFARVYELCHTEVGPRREEMLPLVHWVNVCPSRRGLERWSMKNIQHKRRIHVKKYVQYVLNSHKSSNGLDPKILVAEKLRHAAEAKSRSARMFAMCMGFADEAASREGSRREGRPRKSICSKTVSNATTQESPTSLVSLTKSALRLQPHNKEISLVERDNTLFYDDYKEELKATTYAARNA